MMNSLLSCLFYGFYGVLLYSRFLIINIKKGDEEMRQSNFQVKLMSYSLKFFKRNPITDEVLEFLRFCYKQEAKE